MPPGRRPDDAQGPRHNNINQTNAKRLTVCQTITTSFSSIHLGRFHKLKITQCGRILFDNPRANPKIKVKQEFDCNNSTNRKGLIENQLQFKQNMEVRQKVTTIKTTNGVMRGVATSSGSKQRFFLRITLIIRFYIINKPMAPSTGPRIVQCRAKVHFSFKLLDW
jgi:hypothetical protein